MRVKSLTKAYHQALEGVEVTQVVFLDETGRALNLTSADGRAPTGERVYGAKPTAPGPRISTLGTLSTSGMGCAMSFEGTLNTQVFLTFIDLFLKTSLQPGPVLVMDHASVHQAKPVIDGLRFTSSSDLLIRLI